VLSGVEHIIRLEKGTKKLPALRGEKCWGSKDQKQIGVISPQKGR